MNVRQLIVNADDFGASEEVNEAVIRGLREGVLTSCSLMVGGEAFEQAVQLANEHPQLAVGIHLVVISGRSVLKPSEIPSLVDGQGCFGSNPLVVGLKYFFLSRTKRDLEKELTAQFDKFRTSGLRFSHIDGHWHFHIHPTIFNLAIRLGKNYGVSHMRVPEDDLDMALQFDPSRGLQKRLYWLTFRALCRRMKRQLMKEGFVYTERVFGFFQTGRMNSAYFLWLLDHLCSETNEVYFHPTCPRLAPAQSIPYSQHVTEYQALVDPRVIDRVQQLGIRLTTYRALNTRL